MQHSKRKHAKFSASGSSKWVNCAGSIQAEAGYKNKSSSAAKEGTAAHELADVCFKDKTEPHSKIGETYEDNVVDEEMANQVQKYMDYVTSIADMSHSPIQFYEKRVDFSNVVPKGFGTLDSAVYLPEAKALHIFDLKYGRGVRVNAFENTQAILYAIGMLNEKELEGLEIKDIYIHICQPRLNHFDEWHTCPEEIEQWHSLFAKAVELALSENPPRTPSETACKWCLAKADCPALAQVVENEILDLLEDETVNTLSDERKRRILEAKPLIEQFISSLEEQVMNTLLEGGEFKGFKIIEGRSITKWKAEAEQYLESQYGDKVFNRKLIGITEAKKLIDKQDLEKLTEKASGSPKLVTENTKGKEIYSIKF